MLIYMTQSKKVNKRIIFKKNKDWQYLTKFGLSLNYKYKPSGASSIEGKGKYEISGRFRKSYKPITTHPKTELKISIFLDTEWPKAMEEEQCSKRQQMAKHNLQLSIPMDGRWGRAHTRHINVHKRPYVWFMAASDCEHLLHPEHPQMPQIEVRVHFTGVSGTEFSHEEIGFLLFYAIFVVVFGVFGGVVVFSYYVYYRNTQNLGTPLMLLSIGVLFEFFSILLQFLHLWKYSYDGSGIPVFHILSIMCGIGSQFFVVLLFVLISWGWTITYLQFGDIDLYIPLVGMLLMLHLIIGGLTYITNDAYYKYHDFEGIQGIFLIILRVSIYAYFVLGFYKTIRVCMRRAKPFMHRFLIFSSVYMLAFPSMVIISCFFAPYVRHSVIVYGSVTTQFVLMLSLLRLFTQKNEYFRISKLNDTILPTKVN